MNRLTPAILTLFFTVSFLFYQSPCTAQLPVLNSGSISESNINPEDIKSLALEDIPTKAQLESMGATEDEIAQIEVVRQQKIAEKAEEENVGNAPQSNSQTQSKEEEIENVEVIPIQTDTTINLVEESEVFGQSYFRNGNLKFFEKAANVKAPDNYILGPGDELSVSIWGYSASDEIYRIDDNGGINTKIIGRLYLKDISFGNAKSLLTARLATVYDLNNSKIEITLNYSRTITVNIIGEVVRPGSYTIPAINTAFNALMSVGGVSKIGSVREIHIKRDGKTHKVLDLYDFLMNPGKDYDFFLQNNDYLYIPPSGKIVKVEGAVKRPGYYEMRSNEKLEDLIIFAGNLQSNSYTKNIQVLRLTDENEILIDVNLDSLRENKLMYKLMDGDIISFKSIPRGTTNIATIRGSVFHPGSYELKKGEKVSDLLQKAGGVVHDAYIEEAILYRTRADLSREYFKVSLKSILENPKDASNIELQEFDEIVIFSKKYYEINYQVHVNGAVRNPSSIPFGESMSLKQAINLVGGLTNEAYLKQGYIVRTNDELETEFITITLDTTNQLAALEQVELQKGDRINIASKSSFEDVFFIEVLGEVREPGTFLFGEGLTIKDALYLAGGRKIQAYDFEIEVSRFKGYDGKLEVKESERVEILKFAMTDEIETSTEIASFKLHPFDKVFVRRIPEYQLQEVVFLGGEVIFPGKYALISKKEKLTDLIERAGGLTETAFLAGATFNREWNTLGTVVLNLKKVMAHPKRSSMNYTLKDGDSILIPRVNELVSITGAIDHPSNDTKINAPHHSGNRSGRYIRKYGGGYAKNALKRKTKVIEANGRVRKTSHILFVNIPPKVVTGSNIIVPFKPIDEVKESKEKKPLDWNKVLTASAAVSAQVASILSVILLGQASGAWKL